MNSRESVARLLHRAGALDLALRLRARIRAPYLTVLTYHHIAAPDRDYAFEPAIADATPEQFDAQMAMVARHFGVIGIDELCAGLAGAPLPPNPLLITFDDGYRSCLQTALPILRRHGLRAAFFVSTRFITERKLYWWERVAWTIRRATTTRLRLDYPEPMSIDLGDQGLATGTLVKIIKNTAGLDVDRFVDDIGRAAGVTWSRERERELVDGLIMTWDEVRALRDAGMDIESHTRNHRVLQTLDARNLIEDLEGARIDIGRELGRAPRTIAYPVGRSIVNHPHIKEAVRAAGYQVGFSNANGINRMSRHRKLDPLDIRRVSMDRSLSPHYFLGQLAVPSLAYVSPIHGY